MKKKKYHTVGTVQKSNRKILERGIIDIPNTQIHDRSLSWLGTVRGKRITVCTEIAIILGMVRFTIRGGRLRYKRYDAHFFF